MDPTQALADIRELAKAVLSDDQVHELAERIEGLDDWMTHGGFPPEQWRPRQGRPPLTEPGPVLDGVVHGRRKSYDAGCHCLACRAANRLRRSLTDQEMEEYA